MKASEPSPSGLVYPTGWRRRATPCDLRPRWAGEFRSFEDWVTNATSRLAGCQHPTGRLDVPAICVDARGRRCSIGSDFRRARDEDAFPIRYFWECERPPEHEPIAWLRDLDGTGSLHPCAEGDPGAIPVFTE